MRDRLFGVASLALAGGYSLLAHRLPTSELADSTGPAGLPVIYAAVLAGLSVMLLARSGRREAASHSKRPAPTLGLRSAALTLAVGGAYVVAVPVVGYIAGITALILATAWTYGGSLNVRTALVAVSGAALLWVLFVWLLGIPQPSGWWPALIGLVLIGTTPTSS